MPLPKARRRTRKDEDSDDSIGTPSSVSDFEDEDEEESVLDDTEDEESEASDDLPDDQKSQLNGEGSKADQEQLPPKVLTRSSEAKANDKSKARDPEQSPNAVRGRKNYRDHPPTPFQQQRREYNRRLKSDPTFTPFVGQFWAHDDRHVPAESKALVKGSQSKLHGSRDEEVWSHDRFESSPPPPSNGGRGSRGRGIRGRGRGRGSRRRDRSTSDDRNVYPGEASTSNEQLNGNADGQPAEASPKAPRRQRHRQPKASKSSEKINDVSAPADEESKPEKSSEAKMTRSGRQKGTKGRKDDVTGPRQKAEGSKGKQISAEDAKSNGKNSRMPDRNRKNDGTQRTNDTDTTRRSDAKIPELEDPWEGLESVDTEVVNFEDLKSGWNDRSNVRGRRGRGFRARGRGGDYPPYDREYAPRYGGRQDVDGAQSGYKGYGRRQSLDDARNGGHEHAERSYPRESHRGQGYERRYGPVRGRGRGSRGFRGGDGYDRQHANSRRGHSADGNKMEGQYTGAPYKGGRGRYRQDYGYSKGGRGGDMSEGMATDPATQAYYDEQYAAYYAEQAQYYGTSPASEDDRLQRPNYHQDYYHPTQVTYDSNGEPILLAQNPFGLLVPLHYYNGTWVHPTAGERPVSSAVPVAAEPSALPDQVAATTETVEQSHPKEEPQTAEASGV